MHLLAFVWPSTPEIVDALPVILSLILIEGLLSVDNALAIAAMASHLPARQKYLALRLGIIGAYVFRGVALAFAAWIIENPWLKIAGAAYLIYLMIHHFNSQAKTGDQSPTALKPRGFWGTIVAIEIMDISLSVDNVVAAVALSPKLWVVCAGVFIGILTLRFVAGYCIRLIEKLPILEHTAFLLIGYVGLILVVELTTALDITTFQKFLGIVAITALSIFYAQSPPVRRALSPAVRSGAQLMRVTSWPLRWLTFAVRSLRPGGRLKS
jgi:YkoY family integral membrane protein